MTADDLRREIDASRRAIQGDYSALRTEMDFGAKTRQAISSRPGPWLGGAALLGYILSGRKRARAAKPRKGEPALAKPAKKLTFLGIVLTVARLIFPFIRPAVTAFATQQLGSLAGRLAQGQARKRF